MIHHLKILPKYFNAVADGRKTFEVRYNDREYMVSDKLYLEEYNGSYTGRVIEAVVTYILNDPNYLAPGYVVLAIKVRSIGYDSSLSKNSGSR